MKREKNISRLRKTVCDLESLDFIETRVQKGRTYFLVRDPRHAFPKLFAEGKLTAEDITDANELMAMLNLTSIVVPK